ncbi:CDP-diacylglycerol--glycerol-3-phosphate 3-phosphatidyltransferase [Thalassomonas viridans]|uniref:CDP-diacylglycerol--glycerol-3-phosphate 3-phosphatidyltransferase n=1 Tax=Thalassomonas viridans TaxID=137584 RepID=A0AAE9Z845_9GAMM|nr:CDP-diacylglycerol--glycerol-3-phosphate 3-phosphatidyltransferase [Thalassomonas viridans]WDE07774.1 CDP-diacylglycerol--glycerol-3-phosphate 3-phosphatidyltransferase [Thalassomonas viridans]
MWTIPNQITFFRIILIPVFLIVFYLPVSWHHFGAAFIFWLAAISDALDGYLARRLKQSTDFGAFIDPVADKLMVTCALVVIVQDYHQWWISIPALIMVAREVFISALREFMSSRGKRDEVAVSTLGKYKTAAQMLALIGLIWRPDYDIPLILFNFPQELFMGLAYVLYFIATILTFWSMVTYFRAAWGELTVKKHP